MNLNPLYHLRRYRRQAWELAQQKQFTDHLLNRNAELIETIADTRQQLDQANATIAKQQEELDEIQSEFLILVNAKTISRKEARAIKNHKTKPEQYPQGLKVYS